MPRRARLTLPNVPLHLIQRGINRQACFFADQDYRFYLTWLGEHAGKCGCRIHAYVLIPTTCICCCPRTPPRRRGAESADEGAATEAA